MESNRDQIIQDILNDKVVGVPTDTVYGLAVSPTEKGKKALIDLKGNDPEKKFTIMFYCRQEVEKLFKNDKLACLLVRTFMPGAITIISKVNETFVGARVPTNYELLDVIMQTGPLLVSSANLAGQEPFKSQAGIAHEFKINVLDGECANEIASTIVKVDNGNIEFLREGSIEKEKIMEVVNE